MGQQRDSRVTIFHMSMLIKIADKYHQPFGEPYGKLLDMEVQTIVLVLKNPLMKLWPAFNDYHLVLAKHTICLCIYHHTAVNVIFAK